MFKNGILVGMKKLLVLLLLPLLVWYVKPVFALPGDQSGVNQGTFNSGSVVAPSMIEHVNQIDNSLSTGNVNSVFFDQSQISTIINSLSYSMTQPKYDPTTGKLTTSIGGGAIGFLAGAIDATVRTKPASSIDYVAYEINRLHVPGTPEVAYADSGGLGFNSLTPVLKLWTVMRNLAYIIFAIIFVVIGIMIMTRQKIDPKTVASIQNALPKIIFALILVTFSYAIAGFMIDLMYVALGLIVTIFTGINTGQGQDLRTLLNGSIFNFVFTNNGGSGLWGTATTVASQVGTIVDDILNSTLHTGGSGTIFGLITSGLAFLIVAIAILIALFRAWLALIGAFANIILGIIFAPLRLMLDAIPGQNQFTSWMKDLLVNLLAFPLVTVMLAVGAAIATNLGQGSTGGINSTTTGAGFVPPLIGAGTQGAAQAFVGLGILLTIPKALDILREILKAPAFKYGSAWMENVNISRSAVQPGIGKGYQAAGDLALGPRADEIRKMREDHAKDISKPEPDWRNPHQAPGVIAEFLGFTKNRGKH